MQTAFTVDNYDLYNRDLNMMKYYIDDAAKFISIMRGISKESAKELVTDGIKTKKINYVDPKVAYLARDGGDRTLKYSTMSALMKEIEENNFILSPTMTAYTHPNEKKSVSSYYIESELKKRAANKKEKFKHEAAGNKLLAQIFENRQQRNKIKCNSMSGAQGTSSSILFLKTAHSSLTSTCRSASNNTNANVERFGCGNRHYWSIDIAINNIISILNCADYDLCLKVLTENKLHLPTAEEMIEAVKRCTDLYVKDDEKFETVIKLCNKLTPEQRAIWLYTGDFYNLANYNDSFARDLITGLIKPLDEEIDVEEAEKFISAMGGDEFALIGITANHILKGKDIKSIPKDSADYLELGKMCKNIFLSMTEYHDYFNAFLVNRSICPSMAMYADSVRSIIVGSDTDSCIFTNQLWVEWYCGKADDSAECFSVSAAITHLCSQYTIHVLAIMSGCMNVPRPLLRHLEMKNEYAFNFFSLTTMAKHYYATKNAQEGNVYAKPKWEVKGVTLKNTNAPSEILKKNDAAIMYLGTSISKGGKLKFREFLQEVANIEHHVIEQIKKGNSEYFGRTKIHSQSTYKKPNGWDKPNWGNYRHHEVWNNVFGDKYGKAPEPTYLAIKVNSTMTSPTMWEHYRDSIADESIKEKINYFKDIYGTVQKTFYLPKDIIDDKGLPEELYPLLDIRGMVAKIMKSFYLLLESLGFYLLNKKFSRLISDEIEYDPNHKSLLEEFL